MWRPSILGRMRCHPSPKRASLPRNRVKHQLERLWAAAIPTHRSLEVWPYLLRTGVVPLDLVSGGLLLWGRSTCRLMCSWHFWLDSRCHFDDRSSPMRLASLSIATWCLAVERYLRRVGGWSKRLALLAFV